jgi:hypothetical protein
VTEAFPFLDPLNAFPGIRAFWIGRIPDLPLAVDRDEAMRLLRSHHAAAVRDFAGATASWARAEQVHGNAVAVIPSTAAIPASDGLPVVPLVDGLITNHPDVVLAIYVADCGPIWLADRKTGAIGLLHSGRKGTEENILASALNMMAKHFGTKPEDVTAVLGPCIRPPDYEVDFAAQIARQANESGIGNYSDCGLNTASDLQRHYSYRREMGKTGRMMAMIVKKTAP